MTVVVTGGTGLVGQALIETFTAQGEAVRLLTRSPSMVEKKAVPLVSAYRWDLWREPAPEAAFDGARAVIHLAGENVGAGRWTAARREAILQSRVLGTRHLVQGLKACACPPAVLVSASAVGFYGDGGDEVRDESSPPGRGFLAEVCQAWEQEALTAQSPATRVCRVRLGMVLSPQGGALAKMLPAFRAGLGGPLGSGRQWLPWISLRDAARLFHFAAETGNKADLLLGVAPEPVRQRDFATALGKALSRPAFLPAPAFTLRLALGDMASLLLDGQKADSHHTEKAGFRFGDRSLEPLFRQWFS